MTKMFKDFAQSCVVSFRSEVNNRNNEFLWYFAVGYIKGKISEKFNSINPIEFADYVVGLVSESNPIL